MHTIVAFSEIKEDFNYILFLVWFLKQVLLNSWISFSLILWFKAILV